jgi:signal transduction histidine kinase
MSVSTASRLDLAGARQGHRMKLLVQLWLVAFVLMTSVGGTAAQSNPNGTAAQPKRILFLSSYGQGFQPWVTWTREIRREMDRQSPWPLSIQEHYVVTALSANEAADAKFVDYLRALYDHARPDLIVAFGAPAARFVQQHRAGLFPKVPMLLAAVNVRRVTQSLLSEQDAVVGTEIDNVVVFENILRLLPATKTIAMIIGNSPPERFWVEDIQRELKPLVGNKVELLFFNERPFEQTLDAVAKLPPHSAIYFQQMMVDGAGAVYGDKEPLKRIAKGATAPIFAIDQTYFDGDVVGGPMTSPAEGAKATGSAAIRMLRGESASNIRVPAIGFASPIYDWRQLRRWNIGESRLPPGSEVMFRESSAWERYSWQIIVIIAAILLQAGLIAVLLQERNRRHLAEVKSRQHMAELVHVNRFATAGELGALIAHEISQPLNAILFNAEAAQIVLKSPSPDVDALREIVTAILHDDERASEVIKRMRSLLKKAPFELTSLDVTDVAREAIKLLSTLARERKVELLSVMTPDPLPILGDRIQLQQVILNLALNAMDAIREMPSRNRTIRIRTSLTEGFAELSVSDRGPGIPEDRLRRVFDPFFTTKADGMGMGLSIARTIIEAHNGQISAANRNDGGTSFRVKLPLVS